MSYEPKSGYPHPPPQYTPTAAPMQFQPTMDAPPAVITHQPFAVLRFVGPTPTMIVCPSCNHNVLTRLDYESTTRTHLIALGLCLLGCWPCVIIPYCMDSCRNANHYCPSCQAFVGTYQG